MRHIPNALCILRMLLVVPVAWLLSAGEYQADAWLFAFAAATDGLDGFLAKRCGWTSELGKILDPLADKILLVGVFITLAALGIVPVWLAVTAVARDVTITAGAISYNALYRLSAGRPTVISKINTLCQILYLLLVVAAKARRLDSRSIAITVLGALVFVTTVVSGIDYVLTYSRKAIEASRQQRAVSPDGRKQDGREAAAAGIRLRDSSVFESYFPGRNQLSGRCARRAERTSFQHERRAPTCIWLHGAPAVRQDALLQAVCARAHGNSKAARRALLTCRCAR